MIDIQRDELLSLSQLARMQHVIRCAMESRTFRKFNGEEAFADLLGKLAQIPKEEAGAVFAQKFPAAAKRMRPKKRKKKERD